MSPIIKKILTDIFKLEYIAFTLATVVLVLAISDYQSKHQVYRNIVGVVAAGNTYYVSCNGNDNYSIIEAQNPKTPWATIKHCLDLINTGDKCLIKKGVYNEKVIIYKSNLSLVGDGMVAVEGFSDFGDNNIIKGLRIIQ